MTTHMTALSPMRIVLMVVLVCLAGSTAYAFSIWNFLNVGLGSVSPYSVFREHDALRITQVLMVGLLFSGALLYGRLRYSLPARGRWACMFVLAAAAGHLGADCLLRLLVKG